MASYRGHLMFSSVLGAAYGGAAVLDGEERYTGVGHTNGLRVLVIVWTMRGQATRPVTAFEASERLTKRYMAERGF